MKNGGHHIPTEDILRRHTKSRDNLLQTLDGELILETSQGNIAFQSNHIPQWVTPIIEKL
ncbi:hypothetical protein [Paenisporosarcina sp. TG20]|uniref:hypothetical protein n=1 Tax=Paenisporosarcina sp. TG20 TaxID=1211706 RepID=UPI00031F1484|nr:hypothetical protein [Paenisporosarcina sp. TG20]